MVHPIYATQVEHPSQIIEFKDIASSWIPYITNSTTRLSIHNCHDAPTISATITALRGMPKLQFLCLDRAVSRTGDYLQMVSQLGRAHVRLPDLTFVDVHEDLAFCHEVLRCIQAHPDCVARVQAIGHDQPEVQIPYVAELNTIGKYALDWMTRASGRGEFSNVRLQIGQAFTLAAHPVQGGSYSFLLALPKVEDNKRWIKNRRWERAFVAILGHLLAVDTRAMTLHIDMDSLRARVEDVGNVFANTLEYLQDQSHPGRLVLSIHADTLMLRHVRPGGHGSPAQATDELISLKITKGAAWNEMLRIVQNTFVNMQAYAFTSVAMEVSLALGDAMHARLAHAYGAQAQELLMHPGKGNVCVVTQLAPDAQGRVPYPILRKLVIVDADLDDEYFINRKMFDHLLSILAARYAATQWRALPILRLENCRGVTHPRLAEFSKVAVRIEYGSAQ